MAHIPESANGVEEPRTVYLNACQAIADELSKDGYKFPKVARIAEGSQATSRFKFHFNPVIIMLPAAMCSYGCMEPFSHSV